MKTLSVFFLVVVAVLLCVAVTAEAAVSYWYSVDISKVPTWAVPRPGTKVVLSGATPILRVTTYVAPKVSMYRVISNSEDPDASDEAVWESLFFKVDFETALNVIDAAWWIEYYTKRQAPANPAILPITTWGRVKQEAQ